MSDDPKAGKGRPSKATRAAAGGATAKSMKVRMKTLRAGPDGISHPEEVVDLPKAEANALIEAGAAVPVPSARREAKSTLVEPTPADLSGLTLVETVKRFVLEDPRLRRLKSRMERDCPGWPKDVSSSRWGPLHASWPIKFERGNTPEGRARRFKEPILILGSPEIYVPEQVTAVCHRLLDRVVSLFVWLRDGSLVADGIKEPPSDDLDRKRINAGWWSRDDVEVNLQEGKLLRIVDRKPVLVFSDIRVFGPEDVAADPSDRPRNQPGRPSAKSAILKVWDSLSSDELRELLQHPNVYIWDEIRNIHFGSDPHTRDWSDKTLEKHLGSLVNAKRREFD